MAPPPDAPSRSAATTGRPPRRPPRLPPPAARSPPRPRPWRPRGSPPPGLDSVPSRTGRGHPSSSRSSAPDIRPATTSSASAIAPGLRTSPTSRRSRHPLRTGLQNPWPWGGHAGWDHRDRSCFREPRASPVGPLQGVARSPRALRPVRDRVVECQPCIRIRREGDESTALAPQVQAQREELLDPVAGAGLEPDSGGLPPDPTATTSGNGTLGPCVLHPLPALMSRPG